MYGIENSTIYNDMLWVVLFSVIILTPSFSWKEKCIDKKKRDYAISFIPNIHNPFIKLI